MSKDKELVSEHEFDDDAGYTPDGHRVNGEIVEITSARLETPFLPPRFLEEYERVLPGSGKQMFDMVVKQQEFSIEIKRHEIEINNKNMENATNANNSNIIEQKEFAKSRAQELKIKARGQIFAFVLAVLLIILSGFFAYINQPWLASLPIGTIIGVITVMFLQKKHTLNKKDNNDNVS